ncbi:calcium-binding protein [Azospirillum sp. A26]|uniref:calcium-binding protein n=1 Tax=Azospirillum sp. A26 TaxID=3160607 RepID=UPI00366C59B2
MPTYNGNQDSQTFGPFTVAVTVNAGGGDDIVFGSPYNDVLNGEDGNDSMKGGQGNDTLTGGEGNDLLFGEDQDDLLIGHEGADTLIGGNNNDTLYGGLGNDLLIGDQPTESGIDWLIGNQGDDTLIGGNYSDNYVYDFSQNDGFDTIFDFSGSDDTLYLNGINISDVRFSHGSGAYSNDLIIYSSSDYQADGILSGAVTVANFYGAANGDPQGVVEYLGVGGSLYRIG